MLHCISDQHLQIATDCPIRVGETMIQAIKEDMPTKTLIVS